MYRINIEQLSMDDANHYGLSNPGQKVIGEGSYGCVVKPSLDCTDNYDTRDKVAKLMLQKDAEKEMRELDHLYNIPGIAKYVVSKPHLCAPVDDSILEDMRQSCENKRVKGALSADELRMIVSEDGGTTLYNIIKHLLPSMSPIEIKEFIVQWKTLFGFLCFFYEHKLIHHDLKTQNVLYNLKSNQLRIIDFGKVRTYDKFIRDSKEDDNNEGVSWFNYPPENHCTNHNDFKESDQCQLYRRHYSHSQFLQNSASTFDLYSIGLMMKKVIDAMKGYNIPEWNIPTEFFQDCISLFSEMGEKNLKYRPVHPCVFQKRYDTILSKHHIVQLTPVIKDKKGRKIKGIQETLAEGTTHIPVQYKTHKCSEKQVYNPFTKKCVSKCKKGKVRVIKRPTAKRKNAVFKCTSSKSKSKSNKSKKSKQKNTKK